MTPDELLTEAKSRFVVLYHKEDAALTGLLKQALGKYQDKAGLMSTVKVESEEEAMVSFPSDYLGFAVAMDANRNYIDSLVDSSGIELDIDSDTEYPVIIHYFQNLRDWDVDTDLPNGCVGLTLDYLVALINLPNTDRERMSNAAVEITVDLPSRSELEDKITNLEQVMEDSVAIIMPVIVA